MTFDSLVIGLNTNDSESDRRINEAFPDRNQTLVSFFPTFSNWNDFNWNGFNWNDFDWNQFDWKFQTAIF